MVYYTQVFTKNSSKKGGSRENSEYYCIIFTVPRYGVRLMILFVLKSFS